MITEQRIRASTELLQEAADALTLAAVEMQNMGQEDARLGTLKLRDIIARAVEEGNRSLIAWNALNKAEKE